jgi:CRP-like cAMP-binding protein
MHNPNTNDEMFLLLRSVSLFTETPAGLLAELAQHLELLSARAGEVIVRKGDAGDCLFIVAEGQLRAMDGERVLNELGRRDLFGEMAVLDAQPRSATVIAITDARLLKLRQSDLNALMAQQPEVAQEMIRILSRRLRARMIDMANDFEYMQQFARVTQAAVAVEMGVYEPEQLDRVAVRTDELGQLARVFQRAIREVFARERQLQQEVAGLRIEIDAARQARQVAEVTETDYFKDLRRRAKDLRQDK